jgi:hypothetical protein
MGRAVKNINYLYEKELSIKQATGEVRLIGKEVKNPKENNILQFFF